MQAGTLEDVPLTRWLSQRLATLDFSDLSADAQALASQCLLDWIGVTVKAADEPATRILAAELSDIGGTGASTVVASSGRLSLRDAVLLNGAAGHMLDYDDVHRTMGHPSVPVVPCALAVGEAIGASGRDIALAIVAGFEAECRVGAFLGDSSYAAGWHTTSSIGVFGAMAAAAKLYGLDEDRFRHAFGIAGTQASGLKAVFGTMTKPLHAGLAAQAGLLAAALAARGFTSAIAILEGPQGNGATQSAAPDTARAMEDPPGGFHILQTFFKYHAACYLTHSAIEAAARIRDQVKSTDGIASISVDVDPGHFSVCNIASPRTGLEMKFSLRMTTALALTGENTADDATFSDHMAARPDLVALCECIEVRPIESGTTTTVTVTLHDGRSVAATADIARPEAISERQSKLERKMRTLAEPVLGEKATAAVIAICRDLPALTDVRELLALLRPQP